MGNTYSITDHKKKVTRVGPGWSTLKTKEQVSEG